MGLFYKELLFFKNQLVQGNPSLNLVEIKMPAIHFTLAQIEAFACVCETNNLSLAATRLQKSRATVSELVDSLEINLGYTLFDRTKRPLQLTSEGKKLYTQARLFLHEANIFDQLAMQMPKEIKQTITLCYDSFIPFSFIQKLIHYGEQQHIKFNLLNIERTQAEKMLLADKADIGIYPAANRMINADFKWCAIGMIELGIYANKSFFSNAQKNISMLELASSNQFIPFMELSEQLSKIIKISDNIQQITNIELLKELLNNKKGWSLLPTHFFTPPYKDINRFHTELGNKGMMLSIVSIWKPTANKQLQQFIQQIVDHIDL